MERILFGVWPCDARVADGRKRLATLFSMLCRITPDMAMQIFYSATSFHGRIDIFKAAITAAKAREDRKDLARAIIAKARQYSAFRNKFAHDQPLLSQCGTPARFEILMVHGRAQFQSDDIKDKHIEAAVTVPDIKEAAACFRDLATLIRDFWAQLTFAKASLDELQSRLAALPNLPRPKDQSPPSATPKRRRSPSRE